MELYSQNKKIGDISDYKLVEGEKKVLPINEIGSSITRYLTRQITPDLIIFSMPSWKIHSSNCQIRSKGSYWNIVVKDVSFGNNGIPVITAVLC